MFETLKLLFATGKIVASVFFLLIIYWIKHSYKSLLSSSPITVHSQMKHIFTTLFCSGKEEKFDLFV